MLKLPKGLKKKKKKSKKDQELFTEEELEQYKREQRAKQQQQEQSNQEHSSEAVAAAASEQTEQTHQEEEVVYEQSSSGQPQQQEKKTSEEDEEWSKFKALTAGVDTILHKTQDELDRIKSTSFYQRVPTEVEKKKLEEEEARAREEQRLEEERKRKEEEEANRDVLAEAVVELSDSEEESEEADDIFETGYIDAITSGELQFAVVTDSPELDLGPDPFDTSYADTCITGPQVSKSGKKLVSLGSAVEVLTGRVDSAQAVALSGAKKKPRKGITNLLLESEEEAANLPEDLLSLTPEPHRTLLDDIPDDELPDAVIDLSSSLHLTLLAQKKEQEGESEHKNENQDQEFVVKAPEFDVSEFDILKDDEDDEFAELAAESLTKKEEPKVIAQPQPLQFSATVEGNWAEFEQTEEEKEQKKAKPPRPPRPPTGPAVSSAIPVDDLSDDEFNAPEDDPFDTAFVEQVIEKKNGDDDDFDFDPRAGEESTEVKKVTKEEIFATLAGAKPSDSLAPAAKDLLGGSNTNLAQSPIVPAQESVDVEDEDYDPFDTSAVSKLVEPKETELKILAKDLLSDSKLKTSLSDPDFDPRAGDPELQSKPEVAVPKVEFDTARRKSSLSLNIQSKTVGFLVPGPENLLGASNGGKIQKPLTPYYAPSESIQEKELEDPFDTSFVPKTVPTDVELKHIEKDLLSTSTTLKHNLSDPDFNPRADDNKKEAEPASDLLSVEDSINIKVLTPKLEQKSFFNKAEEISDDPFDTSIASNIQPGRTELKLLENELLPPTTPEITTGVLDTLTDAQELGLGDKVLTPRVTTPESDEIEEIDPFDTSFAANLGPGQVEIKLIENEFSDRKY